MSDTCTRKCPGNVYRGQDAPASQRANVTELNFVIRALICIKGLCVF